MPSEPTELNPPEQNRTYSSVLRNNDIGSGHARSMLDIGRCWHANSMEGEWICIDAEQDVLLVGVVVQAHADRPALAPREIKVDVRTGVSNEAEWTPVDDGATFETPHPGRNPSDRTSVIFARPIVARFVRLTVMAWNQRPCLRAGLLIDSSCNPSDASSISCIPAAPELLPPCTRRNYGHAYWKNCWRRHNSDRSPDILCFETGYYGLTFNMSNLTKPHFGTFGGDDDDDDDDDDNGDSEHSRVSYTDVLDPAKQTDRMETCLSEKDLVIWITVGDAKYRVKGCQAGDRKDPNRLSKARLWEAGKLVQHYDLLGLVINHKSNLKADGVLDICVWPKAFAITLELSPKASTSWDNGAKVEMKLKNWAVTKTFQGTWTHTEKKRVTLLCQVTKEETNSDLDSIKMSLEGIGSCKYKEDFGCYLGKVSKGELPRTFKVGYTDIRDYDVLKVNIENTSDQNRYVPFLLDLRQPANITGLVPMVCDATTSTPLGIPIQTSKNWHYKPMGAYLHAYTLLPVPKNSSISYNLIIVYGFYGALPSASHANLSLVGWGGGTSNGRWEQLAIGCFGETFCMDAEFSAQASCILTDIRALMIRNGVGGIKWGWTNAGWGGDWLNVADGKGKKMFSNEMKVAYVSQGPCLTEVHYGGYYGPAREVAFQNTVRTLRTDDYARTFLTLDYTFRNTVSFDSDDHPKGINGSCFFRMGGNGWEGLQTPSIAYGNVDGLIDVYKPEPGTKADRFGLQRLVLTGQGPWWIAYNGTKYTGSTIKNAKMGHGWKALVIRSYQATIDGNVYENPNVSFWVRQAFNGGMYNLDTLLTPPEGVKEMKKDDRVHLDVEWVTLPCNADDYYGPNEVFRKHLEDHADSWETVFREAKGNNYEVTVKGGDIKKQYPLLITAAAPSALGEGKQETELEVVITGGAVGALPIRFEGLDTLHYALFQVANDYQESLTCLGPSDETYETGFDPETGTYSLTFNIEMDGLLEEGSTTTTTNTWVLKRKN